MLPGGSRFPPVGRGSSGSHGSDGLSWRKQISDDQRHKEEGGGTDKKDDQNPLKKAAANQILAPKSKNVLALESGKVSEGQDGGTKGGMVSVEIAGSGEASDFFAPELGGKKHVVMGQGSGSASQKGKKGKYNKLPKGVSRGQNEQSLISGEKKRGAANMDVDGEEEEKKARRESLVDVQVVEIMNAGLPGQSREKK